MNVLVTGSNGYIGNSIVESSIKDINIFKGNRDTIDLFDKHKVADYIKKNKIDCIIHCAIQGGNRMKQDDASVFYNNLLIFENLFFCRDLVNKIINIASGAEFDRSFDINLKQEEDIYKAVPKDFYGLSKNLIAKKSLTVDNFYNLRLFGCFDENEIKTRFIKTCILKSENNETININEDKVMDFFYLKDLITVIEYYLKNSSSYQDINLSYKEKFKLSQIAKKIIKSKNSKSEIDIQKTEGLNDNGEFKKLISIPIKLIGLEDGINKTIIHNI